MDSFKDMFSREQIEGFVRHGLTTIGGAIGATGLMDAALWQAILGLAVTGAGVLWSWWAKRPALPKPPA